MGLATDGKPQTLDVLMDRPYPDWLFKMAEDNDSMSEVEYADITGKRKITKYALLDPDKEWCGKAREDFPLTGGYFTIDVDLGTLVKLATERRMTAFFISSYAHYMKGLNQEILYFVFAKNVPEEFRVPVVMHEIEESELVGVGERNTRDIAYAMSEAGRNDNEINAYINEEMEFSRKYPHIEGCKLEADLVLAQGQEYAERYAQWLLETNGDLEDPETWFNQVIPGFLAKEDRLNQHPLRTVMEFYLVLESISSNSYDRDKYASKLHPSHTWVTPFLPEKAPEEKVR